MATKRTTNPHGAVVRDAVAALGLLEQLAGEGTRVSLGVHDLPLEAFADKRITGIRVYGRAPGPLKLTGEIEHGAARVDVFSVAFTSGPDDQAAEAEA